MNKPKLLTTIKNHRKYGTCEGCNKTIRFSGLTWFCGHYLCGKCRGRKDMPLVGYKDKTVWGAEEHALKKKRDDPSLSWPEQQLLWKEYTSKGLNYYQAKARINSLKYRIKKSHSGYKKEVGV